MTRILTVHASNPNQRHLDVASQLMSAGGVVLAPTETGYCFFGDAAKDSTLQRFLALRQAHPKQKPFSLLCFNTAQAAQVAVITTPVYRIASRVWPGPYTLILESNRYTPKAAAGPKRKSVGIRVSNHGVAAGLVQTFGAPLLVTSVTDAEELIGEHYYSDMHIEEHWWATAEGICAHFAKGDIAGALSTSDPLPLRVSTVVDFTQDPPEILRDGGWDAEAFGLHT